MKRWQTLTVIRELQLKNDEEILLQIAWWK